MRDRSPLLTGPSDVDWLVGGADRSQRSDPFVLLDDVTYRSLLDADTAAAEASAERWLALAVLGWRLIRAAIRPVLRERSIVVRSASPEDDAREAA